MEGIIKVAVIFTIMSVITLLVYLRYDKNRRYYNLSHDVTSILVYVLTACFFLTTLIYFAATI
ncbi:MAG: hypothetical protein ACOY30_08870 [Bacillota bacterium]